MSWYNDLVWRVAGAHTENEIWPAFLDPGWVCGCSCGLYFYGDTKHQARKMHRKHARDMVSK